MTSEVAKELGGALLFGVPLVYTMEVWWLGQRAPLANTVVMVLGALALSAVVRCATERREAWRDSTFVALRSSVMSLGVAALFAFVLGIVRADSSAAELVGVIGVLSVPLVFGSVLGTLLFASPEARDEGADSGGSEEDEGDARSGSTPSLVRVLFASALGAAFLALPIAPTEEVPMVASQIDGWRTLALLLLGAASCYVVLIASGFLQARTSGPAIEPIEAIALTAAVVATGLIVAALLLAASGQFPLDGGAARLVGNLTALTIPAMLGAAAGRLVAA